MRIYLNLDHQIIIKIENENENINILMYLYDLNSKFELKFYFELKLVNKFEIIYNNNLYNNN